MAGMVKGETDQGWICIKMQISQLSTKAPPCPKLTFHGKMLLKKGLMLTK